MIKNYILDPFCNYVFENQVVSNFISTALIYIIALMVIKLIVKGVKKWYKLFMIS